MPTKLWTQGLLGFALFGLFACAGWDNTAQLKDLEPDERRALCDYAYDAWGGKPVTSLCTPTDEGQLVAVYVAQGERQQQVDYCVADAEGQRWVDCKVSDYVACLQAVDAAGDVCASQTAPECETLATCIAEQQP